MHALKFTQIGNSAGAVFPHELLCVTETPDGLRITKHDPEFAAQMETARAIMKRRHPVPHELAK
ncbi:MAG: AbrB/MazE/SpoVT family DNA-binding domain-containing protein [Proteobacteria bacterium]|nr:AbrB/MazE/SpoVT family DNA-binding domain-containing protein [Burkholderiales bacterium]MCA0310810.1 AbrB/MazE/SpoVT family DNA-binding domain-containing protein [Pseudomonadota bacterium]HQD14762.1 AbrB/MazE/SpoVT family DNA-binding domain-containing protein [Ottowia sp.]